MGRDSSVGIGTLCKVDVPGFEWRWGRNFSHPSRTSLGPTQTPIEICNRSFRGKTGVDHPLTYSATVKERVELYLYSTSGLCGLKFTFTFIKNVPKIRTQIKILGASWVTWSKVHTPDLQILRTAIQILEATVTYGTVFMQEVLCALTKTKGAFRPAACGILDVGTVH